MLDKANIEKLLKLKEQLLAEEPKPEVIYPFKSAPVRYTPIKGEQLLAEEPKPEVIYPFKSASVRNTPIKDEKIINKDPLPRKEKKSKPKKSKNKQKTKSHKKSSKKLVVKNIPRIVHTGGTPYYMQHNTSHSIHTYGGGTVSPR